MQTEVDAPSTKFGPVPLRREAPTVVIRTAHASAHQKLPVYFIAQYYLAASGRFIGDRLVCTVKLTKCFEPHIPLQPNWALLAESLEDPSRRREMRRGWRCRQVVALSPGVKPGGSRGSPISAQRALPSCCSPRKKRRDGGQGQWDWVARHRPLNRRWCNG
jgi:hypothetical protein